jgi:hypothetical protein
VGKTKKSRGLTVKPGVNCKDLWRWKGCFVIFKTAGGFCAKWYRKDFVDHYGQL